MNLFMAGNRGKWGPQLVRPIACSIGSDLYCAIRSRRRFAKHRTAPHSTMAPSVILFIYEGFILKSISAPLEKLNRACSSIGDKHKGN